MVMKKKQGGVDDSSRTLSTLVARPYFTAMIVLGVVLLLSSCSAGTAGPSREQVPPEAGEQHREFPSFVYNSAQTLQAYRTAVQIPEVLPLMPCYCNCGEAHGHTSLQDCFFKEDGSFNDHGAFCEICDMEVIDISRWQAEGHSLAEIRQLIDTEYPRYGEPTDTPFSLQPDGSSSSQETPRTASPGPDSTDRPGISFARWGGVW